VTQIVPHSSHWGAYSAVVEGDRLTGTIGYGEVKTDGSGGIDFDLDSPSLGFTFRF